MVKNRNIIITVAFVWLLLLGAINASVSATQPSVDQYTITEINENTVSIEAEFNRPIDEDYLSVSTFGDSKGTIVDKHNTAVSYEIQVSSNESAEMITKEIAFLAEHRLQYSGQQLDGPVTMAANEQETYNRIHKTKDDGGLFIYKNSTKRYVETKGNLKVTVISHLPNNKLSAEIADSVHRMDDKFKNPDESITIYVVPETENGYVGYAFNTEQSSQYFWVENEDSHFQSRGTVYHETVHINQEVQLSENMKWINEGAAEYIGRKAVSTKHGSMFLFLYADWYTQSANEDTNIEDIQLQDPSTWEQNVEYKRGSRVAHIIDVALHYHTDGNMNLYDVVDWLNDEEEMSYSDFRSYIVSHTDASFGKQLDGYLGSTYYIDVSTEKEEITGDDEYTVTKEYEEDENR